jgi:3-dehydroquinate dehydratase / shikimate dehydrogenase
MKVLLSLHDRITLLIPRNRNARAFLNKRRYGTSITVPKGQCMLVTVIAEKNCLDAHEAIQRIRHTTDVIELRLDYFDELDFSAINQLKNSYPVPMIFTLRKSSQGGLFTQGENTRLEVLEKLAQLKPEFIDLEYDVAPEFAKKLKKIHPTIQLIRSYYDFDKTPDNLSKLLASLKDSEFSIYKIVTFAHSTLDCLKMLNFVNQVDSSVKLAGFCMGEAGAPTRILGTIVGSFLHYSCINEEGQVALGQLTLSMMCCLYRFQLLNKDTDIYALLGDPVDKSAGHIVHNRAFEFLEKNAVYVKLKVKPDELPEFFKQIKSLPFKGFSITMPLKQAVIPFLNTIDPNALMIKSVNTIVINKGRLTGYNTDAEGALDAIEDNYCVANKKVVILGTGGAGRAIGYEAIQRHAQVIFLSRSVEKAHELAREMKCSGYGLSEVDLKALDYDVLINTTPIGMSGQDETLPVPEEGLIAQRLVMDTVYNPVHTPLLKKAKALNCTPVFGYDMFINQAVLQLQLWLGNLSNLQEMKDVYREEFVNRILRESCSNTQN